MKKHHEIELESEKLYLRKSILGWSIIYPIKVDGKINWKNLIAGGSWIKLGILILIILIILGCIYEYRNAVNIAQECLNFNNQFLWKS